ncbi:MAG: N-acetylmuramoyl-L-alanine amidase [Leptolyngbyaceae cyanobacterium bins.59]|nr:N-acetylmuramoyl-L-alanine amidase [Leptolyngbyaceae cyanobacterium bins.59]
MKRLLGLAVSGLMVTASAKAEQPLMVVYPPNNHETTADRIFFIGTAPAAGEVQINGQGVRRSPGGHFAPSLPLRIGENRFTLRYGTQELQLNVIRKATTPVIPNDLAFAIDSLFPSVDLARLPGEPICFRAIAPANATVSVNLGTTTLPLLPQPPAVQLPANAAVLTQQESSPLVINPGQYGGCTIATQPGRLGQPEFQLKTAQGTIAQSVPAQIEVLSPAQLEVVEVIAATGVARTGPSTDYSRLTPLPQGTRATVTGREGEWLRLEYGAWIRRSETRTIPNAVPPTTLIRSARARRAGEWTEIVFPLQVPVPITVQQGDRTFTLTLHNTTAQTDTIRLDDNPLISRMDWHQTQPGQVQYVFHLKGQQQWGYRLRYEGPNLILALRHPPIRAKGSSLKGISVLLDVGHGGPEDLGARGPNGYPEKDVALTVTKLLRDELVKRGVTVYLTRETDVDLPLADRIAQINQKEPTIVLSLHYNALPDSGDALATQGVSTFWYNPQSHRLAIFLHNYLVTELKRPSYGVYWNNLALTRPTVAPSVLLELGFMINPFEIEWIMNPQEQQRLAIVLADGIIEWLTEAQKGT